jgi:uncharacterized membrane protein
VEVQISPRVRTLAQAAINLGVVLVVLLAAQMSAHI